jgi:isoaspartyl peptidase/L-asparaginase-like protein (Ntn-hydrolase superfamily)
MGRSNTYYRLSLGGRTHATREIYKKACEEVMRIVNLTQKRNKNLKDIQVGFIALNKNGEYGSYCIQGGFNYAVHDATGNRFD